MPRLRSSLIFFLLLGISIANAVAESPCSAAAKGITSQIWDLCFMQFATDDIAHPGVSACISLFSKLEDNCENRTALKEYRCHILADNGKTKGMSIDQCVKSLKTEGYAVRGCEYPFKEECIEKANNNSR